MKFGRRKKNIATRAIETTSIAGKMAKKGGKGPKQQSMMYKRGLQYDNPQNYRRQASTFTGVDGKTYSSPYMGGDFSYDRGVDMSKTKKSRKKSKR